MSSYRLSRRLAVVGMVLTLVSCAARPPQIVAPAPVAEPIPARPRPPSGASATMMVPQRGSDGNWLTVNSGIAPVEAAWHLRAGLNVAALGCRGAEGETITQSYNAMLKQRKAALAAADRAIQARARAERGADWQDAHDDRMTQLYNFFAMPPVQARFCAAAADVAAREPAVAPAEFGAFAVQALAEISAPFTDFYTAYDRYRVELAAWDARYGSGTQLAAVVATPTIAAAMPVAPATPRISYASVAELDSWAGSAALACHGCRRGQVASR